MNLLDTDVLSHLQKGDAVGAAIATHLSASADRDFRITTVNAYEIIGGAFALLHELRKTKKSLNRGFQLFQELFDYLANWRGLILPYDDAADRAYLGLPSRLRQDLGNDARIAAIALAHCAAVWTCNVHDYKRVPGLTVYGAETGKQAK